MFSPDLGLRHSLGFVSAFRAMVPLCTRYLHALPVVMGQLRKTSVIWKFFLVKLSDFELTLTLFQSPAEIVLPFNRGLSDELLVRLFDTV